MQLAESRQFSWHWLRQELQDLERAATSRDVDKLLHHLQKVVPEYKGIKATSDSIERKKVELKVVGE